MKYLINPPLPLQFVGDTLQAALQNYKDGILAFLEDAADVGATIQVHTVSIVETPKGEVKFTIVAFVQAGPDLTPAEVLGISKSEIKNDLP